MVTDVPIFVIGIVDTRPGGRGESYLVWKRSDTINAIINHPLFSDFRSKQLSKLEEAARKVKRGEVVEYPKGVFIGLSQFYFFDEDRKNYCLDSGITTKKSPKAKKSVKKSTTLVAKSKLRGPKVTKTEKGVFLVAGVTELNLKKLKKGVKVLKGGVRKLPKKDEYVVTVPKGGTIKGLKEMMV